MIRVFDNSVITWTLTSALLLAASHNVLQALRSDQLTGRVNNSLHAVMNTVMAAMLWNLLPSTMLAQILILAGAALWFLIQAVAQPQSALCTSKKGRIKCLYHSLSMAGAALMVAMMGDVARPGARNVLPDVSSMPAGHHAHTMPAPPLITSAGAAAHPSELGLLLALLFGAAAVIFMILLLRFQTAGNALNLAAGQRLYTTAGQGFEALGAAVMALMFAAMTG